MKSISSMFGFIVVAVVVVVGIIVGVRMIGQKPICPKTVCPPVRVDLYIDGYCQPKSVKTDQPIEILEVKTGTLVTFKNRQTVPATVTMPPGWFNLDVVEIPPKKFVILEVLHAKSETQGYSLGIPCPIGTPKVKVGDTP